jgi:hypothetical protein
MTIQEIVDREVKNFADTDMAVPMAAFIRRYTKDILRSVVDNLPAYKNESDHDVTVLKKMGYNEAIQDCLKVVTRAIADLSGKAGK